jgi:hypothetical protein
MRYKGYYSRYFSVESIMKFKSAVFQLRKQCEFLGLTWDELMVFIERNPYAMNNKTIDAFTVYQDWQQYKKNP